MDRRMALAIAIASALLSVGIVAADLQFGVEAELQYQEGGEWVAGSKERSDYEPHPGSGCATPTMRLVVDNDRLIGADVDVRIAYWDATQSRQFTVLDETWSMDRNEARVHAFTIPDEAFPPPGNDTVFRETVYVDAWVNNLYLGQCVWVAP